MPIFGKACWKSRKTHIQLGLKAFFPGRDVCEIAKPISASRVTESTAIQELPCTKQIFMDVIFEMAVPVRSWNTFERVR